jgi:hypothetical protein
LFSQAWKRKWLRGTEQTQLSRLLWRSTWCSSQWCNSSVAGSRKHRSRYTQGLRSLSFESTSSSTSPEQSSYHLRSRKFLTNHSARRCHNNEATTERKRNVIAKVFFSDIRIQLSSACWLDRHFGIIVFAPFIALQIPGDKIQIKAHAYWNFWAFYCCF